MSRVHAGSASRGLRRCQEIAATPRSRSRCGADDDGGFTLLEVIISVVILSTAVVAILGAMTTLSSTSSLSHQQADTATVARDAAEAVKDDVYVTCNSFSSTTPYSIGSPTLPNDTTEPYIYEITELGGSPVLWPPSKATLTCTSASQDPGIQLVQIRDRSSDGRTTAVVYVTLSSAG